MPSLSGYKSELDYSYAPGIFPSMECLLARPEQVRRLLVHSGAACREGMEKLTEYGSYVHLNGNQAVAYARIRKIDSDFKRVERQRYVLTEVARRIQREDPATIVGVVMKLLDRAETNMDLTQLMTIAKVGLEVDPNNIKQFRVPVEGTYESGNYPISDGSKVWSIRPDFAANTRLLHEFIYGE